MTARPLDYGDRYPSDIGDVAPGNPTDGFQERDYRIRQRTVSGVPTRPDTKASPNLGVEKQRIPDRVSFTGIIVRRVQANQYVILRQDGKRLFAKTYGDDGIYDQLSIGETVSLHEGQVPGSWFIEGSERRLEMASIRLTNPQQVNALGAAGTPIPFTTTIEETGEGVFQKVAGGGIRVLKDFSGQYELSLTVHVKLDPFYQDESTLNVMSTCVDPPGAGGFPPGFGLSATKLKFRRQNGFVIKYDPDDCSVLVGIQTSGAPNSILSVVPGSTWASWTNCPRIGGMLRVGTHSQQGWLYLGPGSVDAFGNQTGIGSGRGRLRIVMPDEPIQWYNFPTNLPLHSYFYIAGKNAFERAIKLQISKGGGTGVIYTPSGDYVVDKGLIITGPGITPAPTNSGQSFDAVNPTEEIFDCEDSSSPFS